MLNPMKSTHTQIICMFASLAFPTISWAYITDARILDILFGKDVLNKGHTARWWMCCKNVKVFCSKPTFLKSSMNWWLLKCFMTIFVTAQDLSGTSDTKETKASTRFIRRRTKEWSTRISWVYITDGTHTWKYFLVKLFWIMVILRDDECVARTWEYFIASQLS